MAATAGGSPRLTTVNAMIDAHARAVVSPAPAPAPGPKPRPVTKADLKRELLELARSHGWRGKTYHGALKFVRALERKQRAGA